MKAIFLGKFQPPHLGHIRTILKLSKEFDAVIIGITMGEPKAIEYHDVKAIMDEVFIDSPSISSVLIEGTIEGGTSTIDQLDFDIVVSGNHKVLEILKQQGYQVQFQSRTEGKGYSGSEIRGLIETKKSVYIENRSIGYDFKIFPIAQLKPLEKVFPAHFKNIEHLINRDKIINRPLIIDAKYHIVLDGSHRYAFLLKHGYKYAPVIMVNYDDDAIFVGNHLKHRYLIDDNYVLSKSEVISHALNEQLFSARTTRHFFPFRKIDHPVALEQLEKGKGRDIHYLIENCSIEDETDAISQYIKEINEELNILDEYKKEQEGVKNYLSYQLNAITKHIKS